MGRKRTGAEQMLRKRNKARRRAAFIWTLVILIVTLLGFMIAFINPIVLNYAHAKVEAITIKAINSSVNKVMAADTYSKLVEVKYGADGKITSLTSNAVLINNLSGNIAIEAQNQIEKVATIPVPIGTFSGLPILMGKGPAVNLRVVPAGSINCNFASEFTEAGINQTRHRIILMVHCIVDLIMPLSTRRIEVDIQVMLCESIIIGEVPEWFWQK